MVNFKWQSLLRIFDFATIYKYTYFQNNQFYNESYEYSIFITDYILFLLSFDFLNMIDFALISKHFLTSQTFCHNRGNIFI